MSRQEMKLAILRKIHNSKDILFCPLTDKTKKVKLAEWIKIHQICVDFGLVNADKHYMYTRDVFWTNIKRSSLAKRNAGKKLNSIDEIALEIISSPSASDPVGTKDQKTAEKTRKKNRNSQESQETVNSRDQGSPAPITTIYLPGPDDSFENGQIEGDCCSVSDNDSVSDSVNFNGSNGSNCMKQTQTPTKRKCFETESDALRTRKLKLEVEQLELQNYKLKMEILEKEKTLALSPSKFTAALFQ